MIEINRKLLRTLLQTKSLIQIANDVNIAFSTTYAPSSICRVLNGTRKSIRLVSLICDTYNINKNEIIITKIKEDI